MSKHHSCHQAHEDTWHPTIPRMSRKRGSESSPDCSCLVFRDVQVTNFGTLGTHFGTADLEFKEHVPEGRRMTTYDRINRKQLYLCEMLKFSSLRSFIRKLVKPETEQHYNFWPPRPQVMEGESLLHIHAKDSPDTKPPMWANHPTPLSTPCEKEIAP
jgi:hypothetical protein